LDYNNGVPLGDILMIHTLEPIQQDDDLAPFLMEPLPFSPLIFFTLPLAGWSLQVAFAAGRSI
jgi:hypothetical protein